MGELKEDTRSQAGEEKCVRNITKKTYIWTTRLGKRRNSNTYFLRYERMRGGSELEDMRKSHKKGRAERCYKNNSGLAYVNGGERKASSGPQDKTRKK